MTDGSQTEAQITLQSTINADYDENYSGVSPWRDLGAKYKAKNLIEVCNRAGFKPSRILEVGAGEGSVLMHLSKGGFGDELHALEIAHSGVEVIKSREIPTVKSVERFDGYKIPYKDDSFDAVVLCHVLEHVEFERILLREIRRVAPYCILEVPLDYRDGIDEKYEHYLGYGHINIYAPALIRFLLRSEGFLIEQDMVSIIHEEVMEYIEFVNQKKERTPAALAEFQKRMSDRALAFYSAPKQQAEGMANAYTALLSRDTAGLTVFGKRKNT